MTQRLRTSILIIGFATAAIAATANPAPALAQISGAMPRTGGGSSAVAILLLLGAGALAAVARRR